MDSADRGGRFYCYRIINVVWKALNKTALIGRPKRQRSAFEPADVFLPKLCYLGGDDRRAIRLVRVIGEVFLVVILGGPEFVKGHNFRNDRVIVNAFLCDLVDYLVGRPFLFVRMI